jgi:single-strand DNA-binding protein
MAEGFNRVMLLGNVGADPELRFTQGGQAVLNIRLATSESYLDKDKVRRERTDWHSVVCWGKRGEALAKIIGKGSSIFVEGSLRTSHYDDRDGNKRYKTEIVASNIILAGRTRGGEAATEQPAENAAREHANNEPRAQAGNNNSQNDHGRGGGGYGERNGGGQGQRQAPPQPDYPAGDGGYEDGVPDSIPF